MPPSASRAQHAIRILALLHGMGEPVGQPGDPAEAVLAIRSEKKLQALDFWVRNPDYLADELLNEVEAGRLDGSYEAVAEELLSDPEPALHHYPMPKYLYGAYERIDDAFALLDAYGLAALRRTYAPKRRTQLYLLQAGEQAALTLEDPVSVLSWYPRQVRLVKLVARDDLGEHLKERQYKQARYAGAELRSDIDPVADLVLARLAGRRVAP
ncbi:MAG: hypothetical protein QG597_4658 [Actinomycetota bacterium]|nr:hypothetical protein [Actinomycetota bacterium]